MPPKKEPKHEEKEVCADFEGELKKHGLNESTAAALWENGFTDMNSLVLLTGEDDAMKDLSISIAQRLRLKHLVKGMGRSHAADHNVASVPVSGQAASYTEPTLLNQVLSDLRRESQEQVATGATLSDAAGSGQQVAPPAGDIMGAAVTARSADPNAYFRGGLDIKALKVYEIVDYIHIVPPVIEEEVISEHGDSQFIHRSAAKKT